MSTNLKQEYNTVKKVEKSIKILEDSSCLKNEDLQSDRKASDQWLYGKISREDVEDLFTSRKDGLFLVRESVNFPGDYTLSVCFQNKIEHYRITWEKNQLTMDQEDYFDSLEALVEHYKSDADGLCTKLISTPFREK